MTIYNGLIGFNLACILILPMLGRREDEYPIFRDCCVTKENNIAIYTRCGGENRGCGYGEEELYKDENFLTTYDDEHDCTYATYEFKVPEKWKSDFDLIIGDKLQEVSKEYIDYVKEFYPKLTEQGIIDKLFGETQ